MDLLPLIRGDQTVLVEPGSEGHDRAIAAGYAPASAAPQAPDLADLSVAELKAMAAEKSIDLGDATKKADIVAAIEAATKAG